MRYHFIEQHSSRWPVNLQCSVLEVSRNGYSIAKDLRKRGHSVGKERVRRLMQQMCLKVQCKNTWKVRGTTDSSQTYQPSPDLVQRCFEHTEPDTLWLSDFSELPSQGSKIYAVAIKDQASHRILGMHISDSLHTDTLVVAFNQAIRARNLGKRDVEKKIIFHSDQGGQYNCKDFKILLQANDCVSSMGTAGDCYDNAPMESFWATMKTELGPSILQPTSSAYFDRWYVTDGVRDEVFRGTTTTTNILTWCTSFQGGFITR